jgi:hypothetical protein
LPQTAQLLAVGVCMRLALPLLGDEAAHLGFVLVDLRAEGGDLRLRRLALDLECPLSRLDVPVADYFARALLRFVRRAG